MDTTQKFQKAYEYAKQNPDSEFATELRKRIEGGQFKSEIQTLGLKPGVVAPPEAQIQKEGMQANDFLAKKAPAQIFTKEFLKEVPEAAYTTLVGNALKFIKSGIEAPGNIVQSIQGKPITTTEGTDPITGKPITSFQSDFQNKTLPAVESGQVSPLKATAETVGGTVLGALDTLGAEGLVKGGVGLVKTGTELVKDAGTKIASTVKSDLTSVETGVKTALEGRDAKLLSIFSGESSDAVKKAIQFPKEADLGIQGGDEALRAAVQKGSESSIKAREAFVQAHSEAFRKLAGESSGKIIAKQKLLNQFVDDLTANGIKVKNGKLDFSTSLVKANPGEATKIKDTYEAIKKWDDFSLTGVNRLKQLVGRLTKFATEAGGSSKSPFLGRFYNNLDKQIVSNLPKNQAKAYQEMNKKFTDTIGLYDDMVDAFNSGDPFTKLSGIFGANKDTLRQVVDFYEKTTGNRISPIVAGRTLAEEKSAAFGFLNPRSWVDFLIPPKIQAKVVTGYGKLKANQSLVNKAKSPNPTTGTTTAKTKIPNKIAISKTIPQKGLKVKGEIPKELAEEAKKYKSAEEFVNNMLYHGTGESNVPSILEEGLLGNRGRIGKYKGNQIKYVSFADEPNNALNFASGRGENAGMIITPKPKKIYDLGDIRTRNENKTPQAKEFIKKFGNNELYWGAPEAKKWLKDKGYEAISFKNPDNITEVRVLGDVKNVFNVPDGFLVTTDTEFMGKPSKHFSINKKALTDIWNRANNK